MALSSRERLFLAAAALYDRLNEVHNSMEYQEVWEVAQGVLGPYTGPTYTDEVEQVGAALANERLLLDLRS